MQVRAADAAANDVEEQLALGRRGCGLVDDIELGVGAGDCLHMPSVEIRPVTPCGYGQTERGEIALSEQTSTPILTDQFSKALVYAEHKHHNQVRKGGDIPYMGHLLSVAGLVINDGGSEAQAIAALLHDAVDRKSTRLNSSHMSISYAVFC